MENVSSTSVIISNTKLTILLSHFPDPGDEVMIKLLTKYIERGLTAKQKLERLAKETGYVIGCVTMKNLLLTLCA